MRQQLMDAIGLQAIVCGFPLLAAGWVSVFLATLAGVR